MSSRLTTLARLAAPLLALALAPLAAAAQVQAFFYAPFTAGPAPDPNLPFPGGAPVCTVGNLGSASGFSLNFTSASTQSILSTACGAGVAAQLVHSFGARFVGSLVAPVAGTYTLVFNADDGDVLTINGTTVSSQWFDKGGGPGNVVAALNAGPNPFVFDYYENTFGGAFAVLALPANLPVTPPPPPPPPSTVPEPGTVALLATGLVAVLGARRRSARG